MHLRAAVAAPSHGAYLSIVPPDENRAKIDESIAVSPDTRVVETTQFGDRWSTQALEDGEVRYEETDFGVDEPELNLLAAWCERFRNSLTPLGRARPRGFAPVEPAASALTYALRLAESTTRARPRATSPGR
jgi:hypothetical protein